MLANALLATGGADYCRAVARCCLLAAIWADWGKPAELPAEVRRRVTAWIEMSRYLEGARVRRASLTSRQ